MEMLLLKRLHCLDFNLYWVYEIQDPKDQRLYKLPETNDVGPNIIHIFNIIC